MVKVKSKEVKIDGNSSVNQEIKGRFVAREVLACFSYEMEAVLEASANQTSKAKYPLPSFDDIENLYQNTCGYCGEAFDNNIDICPDCEKNGHIEELEQQPQEVFEWRIVTSWFYEKLKARGCVVLEWGNNHYWGRCTTGQAILLDGIITDICKEMEILDGQVNSWAK